MTEQENLSDDEFKIIFSCKRLRELLLIDVASYPLIYYFMNYVITNKLYEKSESFPPSPKKHLGSFKFNNIITLLKTSLYYIKTSLKKPETYREGLDILFLSRDRFIDIKTKNGEVKSDYLFGNTIHDINKNHPNYKMVLISATFKPVPKIDDVKLYNLIQYSTPVILLKSALFGMVIYLKWKLSRSNVIRYLKDNDCEYALSILDNFFSFKKLIYYMIFDYSLQNILKTMKPKVIMANDDVLNLRPRTPVKNTKFVIMQSASIDETDEKYKKMHLSTFSLDKLIADFFLVSGTKFKDMKKDVKDSEGIMVIGQPRYDILHYVDDVYNRERFSERYKINSDHKIILWTTQCHGLSDEENIANFKAVFETMQNIRGATLITKQHPGEGERYTKMIRKYLKKYKTNAIITPKDSDTYEQLLVCDLMITKGSTTAIEAISLNKPVIIFNLSGVSNAVDYVDQGVALGVYREKDLRLAIENLLRDDTELAKNRARYIEKHLYRIDGNATKRVVNLIEEMIKKKSRSEK